MIKHLDMLQQSWRILAMRSSISKPGKMPSHKLVLGNGLLRKSLTQVLWKRLTLWLRRATYTPYDSYSDIWPRDMMFSLNMRQSSRFKTWNLKTRSLLLNCLKPLKHLGQRSFKRRVNWSHPWGFGQLTKFCRCYIFLTQGIRSSARNWPKSGWCKSSQ